MTIEQWFWITMALWFIFSAARSFTAAGQSRWVGLGADLLPFIAIVLLGVRVMGSAIK